MTDLLLYGWQLLGLLAAVYGTL